MDQAFARLLKLARHMVEGFERSPYLIASTRRHAGRSDPPADVAQALREPSHGPADVRGQTPARPKPQPQHRTPRAAACGMNPRRNDSGS